ncbi:MAG: glycosyltransferase family 2 protein [Desulfosarcina sp.]|nr:glycosyltransferase family 2 protein [Desulfosarcina sp.]
MESITAVILTLNEECNIRDCLAHLDWADRIVIVDSGSTDKTLEYAKDFGCNIYSIPWLGFAAQRNWALNNTGITTEWVIFIDADEEVPPNLRVEIREALRSTSCNAFYLCYKVMLFGKWVKRSSNFPVWHPRVVRFGKVFFKDAATGHGETWDVDGETSYFQEPYIHYSFSKGLGFWFAKHNRLSDIECAAYLNNTKSFFDILGSLFLRDKHKRRQALRALSYHLPFRAFFRFLHQFVIKGGILDGAAGWTYCSLYFAYEIMISAKIKERKNRSVSYTD